MMLWQTVVFRVPIEPVGTWWILVVSTFISQGRENMYLPIVLLFACRCINSKPPKKMYTVITIDHSFRNSFLVVTVDSICSACSTEKLFFG